MPQQPFILDAQWPKTEYRVTEDRLQKTGYNIRTLNHGENSVCIEYNIQYTVQK